jgi:hypothetical protein
MKVGTKSLLFGAHQFVLHPIAVAVCWRRLYGQWPTWREALTIAVHDLGYLGCPDMDGWHGSRHPVLGGELAGAFLGDRYRELVLLHSRSYARILERDPGKLCAPDKLGSTFWPSWVYVPLARLSGELPLYRQDAAEYDARTGKGCPLSASDWQWFRWMRDYMRRAAEATARREP